MNESTCALCQATTPQLKYHGPIRAGTFGKSTSSEFSIFECSNCGVAYLTPIPDVSYESTEYRNQYNDSALIEDYFALHDKQQMQHLAMLKNVNFRGKVIADFGCGGGALLDYVHGLAQTTIAVEPFSGYHPSLLARGHRVYRYGTELTADDTAPKADLAFSMHVIEHVDDPVTYLREIRSSLSDDGVVYLTTPNHDDILLELDFDVYAPFFYRTVHRWYFTGDSLRWAAVQAGFSEVQIMYQQNYDLSNAFCWMRDHKPTGLKRIPLFDHSVDAAWGAFLESSGRSDSVWAVLKK